MFANGVFIIASQLGVSTGADGAAWTTEQVGASENLSGLAYGNGT